MPTSQNPASTPSRRPDELDIPVLTEGDAARRNVGYALRRLRPVIDRIEEPVLYARVKLSDSPNPAQPRPARAQAMVDVNGDLVRAQVAAETVTGAVDLLKDRLRDQLKHRSERRTEKRRRPAESGPGGWRRGDLPGHRPVYFHRPVAERKLIRRKTYTIGATSPEEAVADMEQLDHDFFLFREAATGEDALVVRENSGSYSLVRLHPRRDTPSPSEGVEVADTVPPRLSVGEAVDRVGITGERHLFFEDDETGRGNVLYRRYDGHYGLITPA